MERNGEQQGRTSTQVKTINVTLVADNMAFDQSAITVPASAQVNMNFDNRDNGVKHNFALYQDSSASNSFFVGGIITGPAKIDYQFTAPSQPGSYFFRCDVHPRMMTGIFNVK